MVKSGNVGAQVPWVEGLLLFEALARSDYDAEWFADFRKLLCSEGKLQVLLGHYLEETLPIHSHGTLSLLLKIETDYLFF